MFRFRPLEKFMAAQSHAMPADIQLLHTQTYFDLKWCLPVSMTFSHSDNAVFREILC